MQILEFRNSLTGALNNTVCSKNRVVTRVTDAETQVPGRKAARGLERDKYRQRS